jgi:hypothetical protein
MIKTEQMARLIESEGMVLMPCIIFVINLVIPMIPFPRIIKVKRLILFTRYV